MRAGKNKGTRLFRYDQPTRDARPSSYIYPASCPSTPFAPLALHMAHRHHAQPTMPQLNGSSASIPPSAVVSPVAGPSSQNGTTQSTIIQRLNAANEETWLLIGESLFFPLILLCVFPLFLLRFLHVFQVVSPSRWAILKKRSLRTRTRCGTTPFHSTASPRSLVSPGSKKTIQR
jgi:hypothetical protein